MLGAKLDIPKNGWDDDLVVMQKAWFKWWIKATDASFIR
jgi:hypothetical protein